MNSRNSIGLLLAVLVLLAIMILLAAAWNQLAGVEAGGGEALVGLAVVATVLIFLLAVLGMVRARRLTGRSPPEGPAGIASTTRTLERLGQALRDHEARSGLASDPRGRAASALRLTNLLEKLQGSLAALETIGRQADEIITCVNEVANQADQVAQEAQDREETRATRAEIAQLARQVRQLADRWFRTD